MTSLTSEKRNDDNRAATVSTETKPHLDAESIAIIQQPPTQFLETATSNDSASSFPAPPSLAQSDDNNDDGDAVVGAFLVEEEENGDEDEHSTALPAKKEAGDDNKGSGRHFFDELQHEQPSFDWVVAALEAAVAFRIVWHLHMGDAAALPPPPPPPPPLQPLPLQTKQPPTPQEEREFSANQTPIDETTPSEPASQAAATANTTKEVEATSEAPPSTSCQQQQHHHHPALAQVLLDLGYSSTVVHAITCELEKTWAVAGMQVTSEELVACLVNHPIDHDHPEAQEADAEEADAVAASGAASPSPSSPSLFLRQPAGLPPNAHALCNGVARAKKQQAAQRRGKGKKGVCGAEEDEGVVIPGEGLDKDGGLEGGGGEEERAGFRDRLRHGLVGHGLGGELMRHVPSILFQPPQQPPQGPLPGP